MAIRLSRRFYQGAWLGWVLWFVAIESIALLDDGRSDTFSERWLWRPLFREDSTPNALFDVTMAGLVWLGLHIWGRGRLTNTEWAKLMRET